MAKIIVDGNQALDLGKKGAAGGFKLERFFTKEGIFAYDTAKWVRHDIKMFAAGETVFERHNVEVPSHWGDNALKITISKYIFGKEPRTPEYEDSVKQIFDRIANTYTVWGFQAGYFANEKSALIYNQEMKYMLLHQIWAPNSPVWFNIGQWEQWRWGRPDLREILGNKGNDAYYGVETKSGVEAKKSVNAYANPQASACFILGVKDSMEAILKHQYTEGSIFSSGSGVGINISSIRSEGEPIAGKGSASGPLSFDRGWDKMAGAIKSGGKTRRAARMVVMYSDHPDVFEFVNTKFKQEEIAKVVLQEHNIMFGLRKLAEQKLKEGTPEEHIAARMLLTAPFVVDKSFSPAMDDLIYGQTLSNQNANHTVSMKSGFWMAFKKGQKYATRWVKDPSHVVRQYDPSELLSLMAHAIWNNAEPGLHNNDIINFWSTFRDEVMIETSNPCSEYLGPVFSSCNLSSFNILRFYRNGVFEIEKFKKAVQVAMMAADMNISRGGFPIPEIAINTVNYRTTGIGFANIGGLLMALGIPYDSPNGRAIAASIASLLTSTCYSVSAQLADFLGEFTKYPLIRGSMRKVINMHALVNDELKKISGIKVATSAKTAELPSEESFTPEDAVAGFRKSISAENIGLGEEWRAVISEAGEIWNVVRNAKSFRNSFVTCIAPTGTISAPLGIYEEGTTSAEPEYSLVKHKQLSGGGTMTLINGLVPMGLAKLGYSFEQILTIVAEVSGLAGVENFLQSRHVKERLEILRNLSDGGEVCREIGSRISQFRDDDEYHAFFKGLCAQSEKGKLALSDMSLYFGCGHMENIPWVSQETLKVFDCANIPFGGSRCISTAGHVRMLGALQPFISGASSKTINMPTSATESDIVSSLIESHEFGVKCIAIYRDGSKANAVYSTRLDSGEIQDAWQQLLKTATQIRIQEHANPIRKRLPYRRWGQTVKFTIGNDINGFMTVGISETGTCAEIFGHLGQGGSFINGMFDAFCKAFSIALQYGVPFDGFISSFRYMSFDPSGWVKIGEYQDDDKPEIHTCKSIVDLLMQLLDWMFPAENERRLRSLEQNYISEMFSNGSHTLKIQSLEKPMQTELPLMASRPAKTKASDKAMSSALTCPRCHSYAYVFDGKCRSCRDCGYKDGGCGA